MNNKFVWTTGGNQNYLSMIEVLAKSLLKYSEYKLIVYGFNCDSTIDLPNVTNKRINYNPKPTINSTHEPDLFHKDYSIYFAKYLANLDSLEENYNNFAWIDGDAFVTENIDNSLQYLSSLKDYPLFAQYFHKDINQWRHHKGIRLEGNYGGEIAAIKNIKRNPNQKLLAANFYFYNRDSKPFFEKCLEWNKELNNYSLKLYADDNAFSEERVANNVLWEENKILDLPITWNNYYSSKEETLVNPYFLKQGFDVMYDKSSLEPYFIHGPDPSVKPKSAKTLEKAFNDYNIMKNKNLVIILCYCDTQRKLDLLSNMILSLKDKYDILVSTHSPLPIEIQNNIDYLVYDKSNPILKYPERGMVFWKSVNIECTPCGEKPPIKISHMMNDYGWTVFNLKKNAIAFCQNLDYSHYSFINYDIEITQGVLNMINNPKDFICSDFKDPTTNASLFPSLLFNILSKENANKINNLISKQEYTSSNPTTGQSFTDAEAYWGHLISNFNYVKVETEIVGMLNTGNPDVLNYNKSNDQYKLFFSENKVFIYDNFEEKQIKIRVNGEDITLNDKQFTVYFSKIEDLGYYHNNELINLTSKLESDIYNRIE
jgi:hypothetical protein